MGFPKKLWFKIALSTGGVLASWVVIYRACREYGVLPVSLWYFGPLLWNQAWLVLYTWLQHNDPSVPQYGPSDWTWVKGALSTIDRPYGIFDYFHHTIELRREDTNSPVLMYHDPREGHMPR